MWQPGKENRDGVSGRRGLTHRVPKRQPVPDAKVEVSAAMTGMSTPKVAARPTKEPGVYEARLNFGMAGAWTVEVTAAPPQGGPTSTKVRVEAK